MAFTCCSVWMTGWNGTDKSLNLCLTTTVDKCRIPEPLAKPCSPARVSDLYTIHPLQPLLWSQDCGPSPKPRANLRMLFLPHSTSGMQTVHLATCMGYLLPLNRKRVTTAAFNPVREAHCRDLKTRCSDLHDSIDWRSWSLQTMEFNLLVFFYVGYLIYNMRKCTLKQVQQFIHYICRTTCK